MKELCGFGNFLEALLSQYALYWVGRFSPGISTFDPPAFYPHQDNQDSVAKCLVWTSLTRVTLTVDNNRSDTGDQDFGRQRHVCHIVCSLWPNQLTNDLEIP